MHTSTQVKPNWSIPVSSAKFRQKVVAFAVVTGFGEFDRLPVCKKATPFHDEKWPALFAFEKFGVDTGHQAGADALHPPDRGQTYTAKRPIERTAHKVSRRQYLLRYCGALDRNREAISKPDTHQSDDAISRGEAKCEGLRRTWAYGSARNPTLAGLDPACPQLVGKARQRREHLLHTTRDDSSRALPTRQKTVGNKFIHCPPQGCATDTKPTGKPAFAGEATYRSGNVESHRFC